VFTAAGLATIGEVIGFYGCVGTRTVLAACRATADLAGWGRLAWGAWHAVTRQLASCAAVEALDFLIRADCLAGAAWLLRGLPGGVWLGFAAGKAVADLPLRGAASTTHARGRRVHLRGSRADLSCRRRRVTAASRCASRSSAPLWKQSGKGKEGGLMTAQNVPALTGRI
jgi:hypothetical protein